MICTLGVRGVEGGWDKVCVNLNEWLIVWAKHAAPLQPAELLCSGFGIEIDSKLLR